MSPTEEIPEATAYPCSVAWGRMHESIAKAVRRARENCRDLRLIWAEPIQGPNRLNVPAWLARASEWTADGVALNEAKLFYQDGMLHLSTGPGGYRWASWWEGSASEHPPWFEALELTMLDHDEFMARRVSQSVLLFQKNARASTGVERGLSGASLKRVQAVMYYEAGTLRWWRLEPDGS